MLLPSNRKSYGTKCFRDNPQILFCENVHIYTYAVFVRVIGTLGRGGGPG